MSNEIYFYTTNKRPFNKKKNLLDFWFNVIVVTFAMCLLLATITCVVGGFTAIYRNQKNNEKIYYSAAAQQTYSVSYAQTEENN
ncbi:MAG: hypothetical protein MJ196_03610 [Treponemataceae bacterium]|nr:hypothetical protein [Treponemataceae bacterium]